MKKGSHPNANYVIIPKKNNQVQANKTQRKYSSLFVKKIFAKNFLTCITAKATATAATGTRFRSTHSSPDLKHPRSYMTVVRSPGCI